MREEPQNSIRLKSDINFLDTAIGAQHMEICGRQSIDEVGLCTRPENMNVAGIGEPADRGIVDAPVQADWAIDCFDNFQQGDLVGWS